MLKKLFKKTSNEIEEEKNMKIYAPLTGEILPLEEVPDPVFSGKMMGDGLAILPSEGKLVSPLNGKVIHIAETKHAIGLTTPSGLEVLIHIGLDTVNLKGEGFQVRVSEGDTVEIGDSLIDFDISVLIEKVPSIITPIVLTNAKEKNVELQPTDEKEAIAADTLIIY